MTNTSDFGDLVDQLDRLVPKEAAWIELTQYGGGPDESKMYGNREGYQRLGVEVLKAVRHQDDENLELDLEYLSTPQSEIFFEYCELANEHKSERTEEQSQSSSYDWLITLGCATVGVSLLAVFIVGILTICQWFVGS